MRASIPKSQRKKQINQLGNPSGEGIFSSIICVKKNTGITASGKLCCLLFSLAWVPVPNYISKCHPRT